MQDDTKLREIAGLRRDQLLARSADGGTLVVANSRAGTAGCRAGAHFGMKPQPCPRAVVAQLAVHTHNTYRKHRPCHRASGYTSTHGALLSLLARANWQRCRACPRRTNSAAAQCSVPNLQGPVCAARRRQPARPAPRRRHRTPPQAPHRARAAAPAPGHCSAAAAPLPGRRRAERGTCPSPARTTRPASRRGAGYHNAPCAAATPQRQRRAAPRRRGPRRSRSHARARGVRRASPPCSHSPRPDAAALLPISRRRRSPPHATGQGACAARARYGIPCAPVSNVGAAVWEADPRIKVMGVLTYRSAYAFVPRHFPATCITPEKTVSNRAFGLKKLTCTLVVLLRSG